ncbi:DUF2859 domain-containing protein, partial [Pseudomonas aeruginosa]
MSRPVSASWTGWGFVMGRSPGARRRPRRLGLRPFAVIGDDEASRVWLQRRAAALRERGAVGLVVNV